MQRPTDAQSPQETQGMNSATLKQWVGDRMITLIYEDATTDSPTLARQAGMAMTLLVSANRVRPLQFQPITHETKQALAATADQIRWEPCSNPDPEGRAA